MKFLLLAVASVLLVSAHPPTAPPADNISITKSICPHNVDTLLPATEVVGVAPAIVDSIFEPAAQFVAWCDVGCKPGEAALSSVAPFNLSASAWRVNHNIYDEKMVVLVSDLSRLARRPFFVVD